MHESYKNGSGPGIRYHPGTVPLSHPPDSAGPFREAVVALVSISAVLAIRGALRGAAGRLEHRLFKPLATLSLLAIPFLDAGGAPPRLRVAIGVGLLLSLAGDVFLMLPGDRFAEGLGAFLAAHVAYLVAFTADAPLLGAPLPAAALAAAAAAAVALLWRGVPPRLRMPVAVYAAALVAMAGQAASRALAPGVPGSSLAAAGALLFVVSDGTLATDRFRARLPAAPVWVLSTYWVAQSLIALSLAPGPGR